MTATANFATRLDDRCLVLVRGPDATTLLDNTISNSLGKLKASGDLIHGGLLTPQGKILFAFFVVRLEDGYLLDTDAASGAGLMQRLQMYKLRAKAEITNATEDWAVFVATNAEALGEISNVAACAADPRSADLGLRAYAQANGAPAASPRELKAYQDRRIQAGVADAIADYTLGDTFTHEANWDEIGSVDFTKGCFVGQEVVSRTRHKTVVRKRICRVFAASGLSGSATITAGDAQAGTILSRSSDGRAALAMVRIDRAVSATAKGVPLLAGDVEIQLDPERMATYRAAIAKQAEQADAAS